MHKREIRVRRLESGYWHVRGAGVCDFSQPPIWPCDEQTLRAHAHPEASDEFVRRAAAIARLISAGRAPSHEPIEHPPGYLGDINGPGCAPELP